MLIIFNATQSRGADVTEEEWKEALESGDPWGWFDAWVSDMDTDKMFVTDKDGKVLWEQGS
jgi:hypothetical protein